MVRLLVLVVALLAIAGCKRGDGASETRPRLTIAVVPKGTTHEYWKSVHAGAVKAARELDVDLRWKGPTHEDDLKAQIDVMQSLVAAGVGGIVLAPVSDQGLVGSVKVATDARVPVVVIDSDLVGADYVSFVGTDNEAAGKTAGNALATNVGAGTVAFVRHDGEVASTTYRERGFVEAMPAHPEVQLAGEKTSETLLVSLQGGGVQGIFAPSEPTTFEMLLALRKAGLTGKVHFVGFDTSDTLVQAVRAGDIDGLVVQHPFDMGYLAVRTLVAHIRGAGVERRIDTGSTLVTRNNVDTPEVQTLIRPDLKTWLGE